MNKYPYLHSHVHCCSVCSPVYRSRHKTHLCWDRYADVLRQICWHLWEPSAHSSRSGKIYAGHYDSSIWKPGDVCKWKTTTTYQSTVL